VHVLIHRGESRRPSSTGKLIARAVAGAAWHLYQRETRFFPAAGFPADAIEPTGELWILHPSGEPLPAHQPAEHAHAGPRKHILLLDGTWRQAGEMLRAVEGIGRCVRLPDPTAEPSRYWLRDQPTATQLSTAEALMGVFQSVGEHEAERRLRLHFELHVYTMLLARGRREMAERYLGHSPLLADPHVIGLTR
jgi:DTW domain-containing protein YfiP